MEGAHLQCVSNHYAKFENKMKTVGVTDYTNKTPMKHFDPFKTHIKPLKIKKNLGGGPPNPLTRGGTIPFSTLPPSALYGFLRRTTFKDAVMVLNSALQV